MKPLIGKIFDWWSGIGQILELEGYCRKYEREKVSESGRDLGDVTVVGQEHIFA